MQAKLLKETILKKPKILLDKAHEARTITAFPVKIERSLPERPPMAWLKWARPSCFFVGLQQGGGVPLAGSLCASTYCATPGSIFLGLDSGRACAGKSRRALGGVDPKVNACWKTIRAKTMKWSFQKVPISRPPGGSLSFGGCINGNFHALLLGSVLTAKIGNMENLIKRRSQDDDCWK